MTSVLGIHPRHWRRLRQAVAFAMHVALLCFCSVALAQERNERIAWADLSFEERQLLQELESRWDSLPAERQQTLRRGAQRWQQLQPEQRSAARQQQRRFQSLSPAQQALITQRFQRFNQLSPEQQLRLRNVQRRFQNLPPARRRALRRRFSEQIDQLQEEQRIQQEAAQEIRESRQRVRAILEQTQPEGADDARQQRARPSATNPIPD